MSLRVRRPFTARLGSLFLMSLLSSACVDTPASQVTGTPDEVVTVTATAESDDEEMPATATASPQPTAEPTAVPPTTTPTAVPPTATATPAPTITPSPEPTATATLEPTSEPTLVPQPNWLSYLNGFRTGAELPRLGEDAALTIGSGLHSQYMVRNDAPIAHSEERGNPHFTEEGDSAARRGNLFATSQQEATYVWAINFWVSAPFHLIGIIDPQLQTVGYGQLNETGGSVQMAAVLEVRTGKGPVPDSVEYPVFFPGDGSETWVVRHSLVEWPDPHQSCPGYSRPSGAAIMVLLAADPQVTGHSVVLDDGKVLESCLFDESTYHNANPYTRDHGRTILDERNAVVIMPRLPVPVERTVTVNVTANGQTYSWSFNTVKPPPVE